MRLQIAASGAIYDFTHNIYTRTCDRTPRVVRRLRVPLVGVVVHWRRWRTYEYRSARVFEQVLEQRHFDRRSATAATGCPTVVVVVVTAIVVVVAEMVLLLLVVVVVVPRLLRLRLLLRLRQWQRQRQWRRRRRLLLRGHWTLARRTVRQVVRYELFRFRVDVRRPPDTYPRVVAGLRVLRRL